MSKIYLFLPDFKALIRNTKMLPESTGYNHSVLYYESDEIIYFYKPIGNFVYCYQDFKKVETEGSVSTIGLTQDVIKDLKAEFNAVEVSRKLYETHIELSSQGVLKS